MPESESFSVAVDRLLQAIRPYGRAESSYPSSLDDAESRRVENERLHQWFVRMVDRFCGGEPKVVALEDNLAVFVRLGWSGKKQLLYSHIHTLVSSCDLDDYYLGGEAQAIYLRLDFDYKTLGDPFSHPLAHIHIEGDLSPRFALDGGDCGNIVVDYLEFLYRNYAPGKWLQWVQREWGKQFAESATPESIDPLPTIFAAFTSNQFHILRNHSTQIDRIKEMLRKKKDDLFDLHMDGDDRLVLEYPSAR
jgi:hypothetical protein